MKTDAYHQAAAKAMLEDQLTESVRDFCTGLRIHRWHHRYSKGTTPGWPDEVLVGARGMLFRELKQQGKRPTPAQRQCLDLLRLHGLDADVWQPADLFSGRILAELQAIA